MGKKVYTSRQYKTQVKPVSNPPSGFVETFYDSGNDGRRTSLRPDGSDDTSFIAQSVAAANAITIPGTKNPINIVRITAGAGNTSNVVTLPAVVDGRLLFIRNEDSAGTQGAVSIPSGKMIQLLSVANAWHVVGFATTL